MTRPAPDVRRAPIVRAARAPRTLPARWPTRPLRTLGDVAVLLAGFLLAYLLRFDFAVPPAIAFSALMQTCWVVPLQIAALRWAGVHTFVWRYVGMREAGAFVRAGLWSMVPLLLTRLLLPDSFHLARVPVSVTVIATVLGFGGSFALRILRRAAHERSVHRRRAAEGATTQRRAVLLAGAGRMGIVTAREIQSGADLELKGFVDDDPEKQGTVIQGVPVLGTCADLPRLVKALAIDHVVVSIAEPSRQEVRRLRQLCESVNVKLRIMPALDHILQDRVKVSRIRDLEIEDLLGRPAVQLNEAEIGQMIAGATVLVTGAGGSIGSELARQVARFAPATLLLAERAEFALFTIDRELQQAYPSLRIIPLVADVGDRQRMRGIFADYSPRIVVHAAAHKHVPMMEHNPLEALKNNVLATLILGEIAGEFGADVFVLISTDKAVRPTSVMGATKRTAELIVQDLNARYRTRYVAVRFGNVIGSAGSVINLFREEIRRGGPVRVTHPSMVRYFMTIPEASQLVLQAAAIGRGGEIFVLDMGEPVRILDLAKDTIALSGLRPFEDIEIAFTGLRPGEKLFEELGVDSEKLERTRHPKIYIGKIAPYPPEAVAAARQRLAQIVADGRPGGVFAFLRDFLPEANLGALTGPFAAASSGIDPLPKAAGLRRSGARPAALPPAALANTRQGENFA